jgi:hypothetical protein
MTITEKNLTREGWNPRFLEPLFWNPFLPGISMEERGKIRIL